MARTSTSDRSRNQSADRGADSEHAALIEQATQRAAKAIRRAAARAAADRAHARSHSSARASIGLVLGVIAALVVVTGALASLAIAIGVIGMLVAASGVAVTGDRYPYVTGRIEALVGLLLSVAAVVVGALALAGVLPALDTGTNQVERLHDWLPGWLT